MVAKKSGRGDPLDVGRRAIVALSLDAVYFASAKHFLDSLDMVEKDYLHYRNAIEEAIRELEEIENRYADDEPGAGYDEMEPYCTKLDRDFQSLEVAAYPFIRTIATTHFLCLACLEAHINIKAEPFLTGYSFDEFDKLSISGKWLFYPKLIGTSSFDPGAEPFQSFRILTKTRNALVHYKEKREGWKGYQVPEFMDALGFTKGDARRSLQTTQGMIVALAKMEGAAAPDWVQDGSRWVNVFSVRDAE